jgi:hypothetical protein
MAPLAVVNIELLASIEVFSMSKSAHCYEHYRSQHAASSHDRASRAGVASQINETAYVDDNKTISLKEEIGLEVDQFDPTWALPNGSPHC